MGRIRGCRRESHQQGTLTALALQVREAAAEHATSYVTLEVGANKLGQACTLEAMLHGRVEGEQVLAHETVQGFAFRLPAGVDRAGG